MKKVFLILTLFIFFPTNLFAISIIDGQGVELGSNEICANSEYYIQMPATGEYINIDVLDSNKYILETYQTNIEETKIIIPLGVEEVTFKIYENTSKDNAEFATFKVNDCGLDEIKQPYERDNLKSNVNFDDKTISFDLNTELEKYNLSYSDSETGKFKNVREDTVIEVIDFPETVQLLENYTQDEDEIEDYFEININSPEDYVIRDINNLNVKLSGPQIVGFKSIVLFVLFLVLFLLFIYLEKKNLKKISEIRKARKKAKRRAK